MLRSIIGLAAAIMISGSARAVDFTYSFVAGSGSYNVPLGGLVTGTIFGLTDGQNSSATHVTAEFGGLFRDFTDNSNPFLPNSFLVANGRIVDFSYGSYLDSGPSALQLNESFTRFVLDTNVPIIATASDPLNITFTRVTSPMGSVPETTSWSLMIAGFGLIGSSLRRSRQRKGDQGQAIS